MLFSSCKTTLSQENTPQPIVTPRPINIPDFMKPAPLVCSIEIERKTVMPSENKLCSLKGVLLDENKKPLANIPVFIDSTEIGTVTNAEGEYFFDNITSGNHIFKFKELDVAHCFLHVSFTEGDQIELDAVLYIHRAMQTAKPIIYLYPEEKTEIEVELIYNGKITTTYPKLPKEGWKITAFPDGTLIDENQKEYYALYWEGEPRKSLEITDGFVISKEQTIPFLEEKLALLGLNPKESNEFIIFWLPILEKNAFNLIHFAADDYLEQAQLNISPTPETVIRVMMVFKGLDEEIECEIQDLIPLMKKRSGFTAVEWGGQELPKHNKLEL